MDNNLNNNDQDVSRYNVAEKPGDGNRLFFRGVLVGCLLGLAFILGFFGVRSLFVKKQTASILTEETEVRLATLKGLIDTFYYKEADENKLAEGVEKGLIEGLEDPYSQYYTKEEYDQYKISVSGNYAGIGAVLTKDKTTKEVSIIRIYEDSPAQKAGLLEGDIILSADGYMGAEMELSDFVQHVRGDKGTETSLEIISSGVKKTVTVVRDEVNIPSVLHRMLDEKIGYILISDFSTNTCNEFSEALDDLKSQGAKAVVYDVRSNPGGLVDSVTDVLDVLLPEGTVVYMMDKNGKKTEYTSKESSRVDMPAAVLINSDSASSAEIFSGALRDYKYATLIGTKTYGKGVVQNTFPLSDGSAVKLTIASYYTPNGECIHEKGIEPDIELEYEYTGEGTGEDYEYDKDNQIQKAIEILKKEID